MLKKVTAMNNLLLGSLFDGSGGFPLAGLINGVTPVWASEVEPFPIRVTTKRLPQMKHVGDICKINGAELTPVDIITFGSPCQDLSVANGNREGLSGARSGLFREAIRIVKEMREKTNGTHPRFLCWENVPGAYSSTGGGDFRCVLEEIARIKDETFTIPMPPKNKWLPVGEIVGDGFSVAYRTICAQYFGVPQRRRRIYLIADFAGECAGEVLFERQSVRWNPAACEDEGQGASAGIEDGAGAAIGFEPGAASRLGGHVWDEFVGALRAHSGDNQTAVVYDARGNGSGAIANTMTGDHNGHISDYTSIAVTPKVYGICSQNSNSMKSDNPNSGIYEMDTARTLDTTSGASGNGGTCVVCLEGNGTRPSHRGSGINENISFTLNTVETHKVAYSLDRAAYNQGQNAQFDIGIAEEQAQTIVAKGPGAVCYQDTVGALCASDHKGVQNQQAECDKYIVGPEYIVRRLVPLECCRLQGFPDYWCAGLETPEPADAEVDWWAEVFETHRIIIGTSEKPKSRNAIIKWLQNPYSDAAEYKMWGNGIALPCAVFALAGIVLLSQMTGE